MTDLLDIKNVQDELIEMERKWDSVVRELEGAEEVLEQERLNSSSLQTVSNSVVSYYKGVEGRQVKNQNVRRFKQEIGSKSARIKNAAIYSEVETTD